MKMAKKLLALVLTGVMAMSMLTGCASISSRQVADELEAMLHAANTKATVKAVDDDLANKAVKAAKTDDNKLKVEATLKADVKTALSKDNNDKYVWYTYFTAKDMKKADKAQKIGNLMVYTIGSTKKINLGNAVNVASVKVGDKTTGITAGDKYELSMKEFSVTESDGKKVDYVMLVVTCKAVEVSK